MLEVYELFVARHDKRLFDGGRGVEPRWIPSDITEAVDLNAFQGNGQGSTQPVSPLMYPKWAGSRLSITRPPDVESPVSLNEDLSTLEDAREDAEARTDVYARKDADVDARKDLETQSPESQSLQQANTLKEDQTLPDSSIDSPEVQAPKQTAFSGQLHGEAPDFTPRSILLPPHKPFLQMEVDSPGASSYADFSHADSPVAASSHTNFTHVDSPLPALSPVIPAQPDHNPTSSSTANKTLLESIEQHIALTTNTFLSQSTALQAAIDHHDAEINRIKSAITDLEAQCKEEERGRVAKEEELRALSAQNRAEERAAVERAIELLQKRLGELDGVE